MYHLPRRALRRLTPLLTALVLAGCSGLPASGPEERDILKSEQSKANELGFRIVNVDAKTTAVLVNDRPGNFSTIAAMDRSSPADLIGPGDVLSISVFEIGSGLFSGSGSVGPQAQAGSAGISTSATRENLPPMEVDQSGYISIPYVGRIRAAGRTPMQLQDAIDAGLRSHSQDPQVIVDVSHNIFNSVIVSGEVHKPGRILLTPAGEHLLDAIALAEGPTHPPQDMIVDLIRRARTGEAPLEQV
jgi:polysaccharide export outer membrane protein